MKFSVEGSERSWAKKKKIISHVIYQQPICRNLLFKSFVVIPQKVL